MDSTLNRRRSRSAIQKSATDYRVPTSSYTDAYATNLPVRRVQALVVGCGVAGSAAALRLASEGVRVTMLGAAFDPANCNSYWAQGGIIYKSTDDSPELLSSDIHRAGAGVCHDPAVRKVATEGPRCVEELLLDVSKVPFERDSNGNLALTLEASHNRARILFKADHTGKAITTSMQAAVMAHPNIELLTGRVVFDLALNDAGDCVGAVLINASTNAMEVLHADMTLLGTGGLGDIYRNTSNPEGARGEGVAVAARAGARLKNMQYVQFHPTTLYIPGERRFLLTEALRGEGAKLRTKAGRFFATDYHPSGELAPRDVVARMILSEMDKTGDDCMYLDISHLDSDWLQTRFPTIYAHCLARGIDLTKEPMPVVPAAHYHCGGIKVDLSGRTSVPRLYAAGEVSCTGMHGANRLASTSLLEALVWGCAVASDYLNSDKTTTTAESVRIPALSLSATASASTTDVQSVLSELQAIMWDHVGATRTTDGMRAGVKKLLALEASVDRLCADVRLDATLVGVRNALKTGKYIAEAALAAPISVGTHHIVSDDPVSDSNSDDSEGDEAS
ncbi:L-aspartate oxidase [Saprolegnia parasitica CBS 223.65]|uniref:L-aspartate oxidase n=1 Tax=Saprolegnia parasitica (strain CBS 223.65) TaxID=695850 RepID=A0A067CXG3_SAPPC|nr:L-aspartate oxidase [Saprolegnia parasitica CBS 223.65]KDO33965.1 L-aspartate oxidase [Saprolegnia parasitica CBS 223.65]|eukprot:XP_012194857.1 L-aspartate oxidase [Saprolegnia parasitica CBS 223.65]